MRRTTAKFFACGSLVAFLGACAGHLTPSEKMMWSTYPVATQKGQASAFVINCEDPQAPGKSSAVVLTSAHVLETIGDGPLIIGLRNRKAAGGADEMPLVLIPEKQQKRQFYVRHPTCDIAAFWVRLPTAIKQQADLTTVLNDQLLKRDRVQLHTGDDVSMLGYPEVLPGTEGGFAVLRSGKVASYPVGTPSANKLFLINTDVYPGDSGAPIFISARDGRPRLVGILSSRIATHEATFSHLAVAVDADGIRETIALLMARAPVP